MPWDESGFCLNPECREHLDNCRCRGAEGERRRRAAVTRIDGPESRRVANTAPDMAPFPAGRAESNGQADTPNGNQPSKPTRSEARPVTDEAHRSQLRMAERLAAQFGTRLRYGHGIGWLTWDGTHWSLDKDGTPWRYAIAVVKAAISEADTSGYQHDPSLMGDVRQSETASGLRGILTIAQYLKPISVSADDLDTDPYLLNCANGTLDLRTMELRRHDPADLITKVAGCGYDPGATGPVFAQFLADVLPVADVREFVQRVAGYALIGKVTEHLLPIFTGTGCNGKTTLVELLLKAFGDYAIMADPELLTEHPFGQHPTGQADLLGVRFAPIQETDQGRKLAVSTVKRLTGGDKIRARRMRQDFFEFDPSHTFVMITNHKPRIPGDDPAAWRRIKVVPFDRVIEHPDSTLPDRLALELPAVLAWCVRGYSVFAEKGLSDPETITRRTNEYRISSDMIGRFLAERTAQQEAVRTRSREIYMAYQKWCGDNGEVPYSEPDFADAMLNRGFEKKKTEGVMKYRGIALLAEDPPAGRWPGEGDS